MRWSANQRTTATLSLRSERRRSAYLLALGGAVACVLPSAGCSERDAHPLPGLAALIDDEVWITVDRDTLPLLARLQGSSPRVYGPLQSTGPAAVRVPRNLLPDLSLAVHEAHGRCGGYMLHDGEAEAVQTADGASFEVRAVTSAYGIDNRVAVVALQGALREDELLATIRTLSSYATRHHASVGGLEAAHWIQTKW